jgi:hypothetical protein
MTDVDQVCCDVMHAQLNWACPDHSSPPDCPDALVGLFGPARRYGLYIIAQRRCWVSCSQACWNSVST